MEWFIQCLIKVWIQVSALYSPIYHDIYLAHLDHETQAIDDIEEGHTPPPTPSNSPVDMSGLEGEEDWEQL